MRGGGGNFGVVTEFEFRLHDIATDPLSVEVDFPVDEAVSALRRWAVTDVGPLAPGVGLQAYGGAIRDVPENDTASSHRQTAYELGASTGWTDPAEDEVRIEAARAYAATLEPFASDVNVLGNERTAGVRRPTRPRNSTGSPLLRTPTTRTTCSTSTRTSGPPLPWRGAAQLD